VQIEAKSVDKPAVVRTGAEVEVIGREIEIAQVGKGFDHLFGSKTTQMPKEADVQKLRGVGGYLVSARNLLRYFGKRKLPRDDKGSLSLVSFQRYGSGDWAGELLSRESTLRWIEMRMQYVITEEILQNVGGSSSCEAEFYAAAKALAYASFLRVEMVDWWLCWIRGDNLQQEFCERPSRALKARGNRRYHVACHGGHWNTPRHGGWTHERLAAEDVKKLEVNVNMKEKNLARSHD